jgi:uncharacterized membrane protein YedE/YeeE
MSTPVIGLIMGAMFGASLVLAGLTDPDKIIGVLRRKDHDAIRTIIVFVLVGMLGTWLLQLRGAANLDIKPAAIVTLMIGGAIFGIGFGLTGFGPGTALASAASGRVDALSTIIGMLCGAHVYVLLYSRVAVPLEKIANYGKVTLPEITGSSPASWVIPILATGAFSLLLIRPLGSRKAQPQDEAEELVIKEDFTAEESSSIASECAEAIEIFAGWKNIAFTVIILCLLLLQSSFWLVKTGHVKIDNTARTDQRMQVRKAVNAAATEPRESTKTEQQLKRYTSMITFEHMASIVRIANTLLVLASVLYTLTISCTMTVWPGGQNHICRAFYLSLIMLLLLLPWQIAFAPTGLGVICTPSELAKLCTAATSDNSGESYLYLRFVGNGIVAVMLLFLAQVRSFRWRRTLIRRVEQQ